VLQLCFKPRTVSTFFLPCVCAHLLTDVFYATIHRLALAVSVSLAMDRADHSKKILDLMLAKDDDAPLTSIAQAWVNIHLGGEHLQEAQYIFQELGDRFNWTPKLLNGSAVASMAMGQYEEAERMLMEALANKDGTKKGDTLANLFTNSLHLNKAGGKYLQQLKATEPNHPLLRKMDALNGAFDAAGF